MTAAIAEPFDHWQTANLRAASADALVDRALPCYRRPHRIVASSEITVFSCNHTPVAQGFDAWRNILDTRDTDHYQ